VIQLFLGQVFGNGVPHRIQLFMLRRFRSLIFWLALIAPIGIGGVVAAHRWERGLPGIVYFFILIKIAVPNLGVSLLIALLWPHRRKPSPGKTVPAPWDIPPGPKPEPRGFEVVAIHADGGSRRIVATTRLSSPKSDGRR
jgi:hypothetical protein